MSDNALSLRWAFGFQSNIRGGVHNLSDESRNAIFFISAHTGVIYDYANRRQRLLQGHCNAITCCAVSEDKRWVVTADSGAESMIVVWDSLTGTPIKTIFSPHPNGVAAIDISPDAMFLATLSAPTDGEAGPQQIALWEWTVERDTPLYTSDVAADDAQTCVRFNQNDVRELVTNGATRVIFWSWESKEFRFYSPSLSQRDFKQAVGSFTQSVFVPDTTQAMTATVDGDVIVWDRSLVGMSEGFGRPTDKRPIKIVRLSNKGSINFIDTIDNYLVTATDDGAIRFYDFKCRLVAWFEDLDAGSATSVSFSRVQPQVSGDEPDEFLVPDFVVGTARALVVGVEAALFEQLTPEDRRGTLLVQGFDAPVHGLSTHPRASQLAITSYSGTLQLWDYEQKRLLNVRLFDPAKLRPQSLQFDPHGRFLSIGFTSGVLKVIASDTLADIPSATFRNSKSPILSVQFSSDGTFMATGDAEHRVSLYRLMHAVPPNDNDMPSNDEPHEEWIFLGSYQSHTKAITSLCFGEGADGLPRLISVGEDRRMVEYDLQQSSVASGVQLQGKPTRVEQASTVTACMMHPLLAGAREDLIITANDEYKFKLWNANNKTCRRTVLGPTYGGPLALLKPLPDAAGGEDSSSQFIVYATHHKVVGIQKLGLDGNPNKAMGLIAHPGMISGVQATYDGKYLITAGGEDMAVNLWAIDTSVLDRTIAEGGEGIEPFISLIEGGQDGEFFSQIADYFMYAQLKAQGVATTAPRQATGKVPIGEICSLMRALGYYPSEVEIENMNSEVRYSRYTETGEHVDTISFDDFIKLYVNHRPVLGVGKEQITKAFETLGVPEGQEVVWSNLADSLGEKGEMISPAEMKACLSALLAGDSPPGSVDAMQFSRDILGFEDAGEVAGEGM